MSRCDKPLFRRKLAEGDLEACWDDTFEETAFTLSKGGRVIAEMQMVDTGDALSVSGIQVSRPSDRKKGLGTRMYEQALAFACQKDMPLVSDSKRSEFAEAFWRKQQDKGRATCVKGRGRLYEFPMRELKKKVSAERFRAMVEKLPKASPAGWECNRYEIRKPCSVDSLAGVKRRRGPR